jgi:transketolase
MKSSTSSSIPFSDNLVSRDTAKIELKIIDTLRILSIDMIEKANSGHPGMPLGCAPIMYILWCKIMNFNPENPLWNERDRFILSNGHGCALLYSILYLLGYNYSIEDLENFRQLHSKTPGHPEYNQLLGIEISTGPLGQGIANGVGMAIASKKIGLNNNIYVMCGDGCLMEGISYEATSLAGHLELNNLIILYDDNKITIDGSTDITFTENTKDRFIALNWNVLEIENGNGENENDLNDMYNKLLIAKLSKNKPTIIFVKTTIGYGSIHSGKSLSHGAPLGIENTKNLKKFFNFDENKYFQIDEDVKDYFNNLKKEKIDYYARNRELVHDFWRSLELVQGSSKNYNINENNYENNHENNYLELINKLKGINNINIQKNYATRESSSLCLQLLENNLENIIIGSADLGESNKTLIKTNIINKNNFNGKYFHYGIREHSMMSIANGISTYGIIPIVSTFLVFITYCLAPIRMASLSMHKVIYIFTHDSILLGEDGPTHQPIESLTILRSIPNLLTIRPCDNNEVSCAYQIALDYNGPTAIILTRQVIPNIENSNSNSMKKGAYIIYEPNEKIDLIIISTGSEVSLALDTIKYIEEKYNKYIRLVSMPCSQLYDNQRIEYKEYILPNNIKKISIEAGSTIGWYKYANYVYGIDKFGASGKINDLKEEYGLTINKFSKFILEII